MAPLSKRVVKQSRNLSVNIVADEMSKFPYNPSAHTDNGATTVSRPTQHW